MVKIARRRYIAFRLKHAPSFSKRDLLTMLLSKMKEVSGNSSEHHSLRIIDYDSTTGLSIVRCTHKDLDLLRAILGDRAKAIDKYDVETLGVSGSIKTLKRKFLQD